MVVCCEWRGLGLVCECCVRGVGSGNSTLSLTSPAATARVVTRPPPGAGSTASVPIGRPRSSTSQVMSAGGGGGAVPPSSTVMDAAGASAASERRRPVLAARGRSDSAVHGLAGVLHAL